VALFGPRPLPLTSYGYQPPREATARGWTCTNRENCGTGGDIVPSRWPIRCPQCGWPCDPLFNPPWQHEALGVELGWQASHDPSEYGRRFAAERLLAWRLEEALRQRDAAAMAAARGRLRDYVGGQVRAGAYWSPGFTLAAAVTAGLAARDLDGAADDLCFWLGLATGEGAETDHAVSTNAKTVISAVTSFLAAPGGDTHPRAAEIRAGCLRVAAGCYSELGRPQQDAITRMAAAAPVRMRESDSPRDYAQAGDRRGRTSLRDPQARISSEQLASYGRYAFLGEEQSGIKSADALDLVRPLVEFIWTSQPNARAAGIAELRQHAARGEWEAVGGWKFVREFLDDAPDTAELVDGGLAAAIRMRVTNLAHHLAALDLTRYRALTGGPPSNDGFFGPPVFDSGFGPSRQYYLDSAVAAAARRSITRVPHAPGIEPGPVAEAGKAMWNLGSLLYLGPLVVNPDIAFEPNVVRPAVAAATGTDHAIFMDRIAEALCDPAGWVSDTWNAYLGATRFAEDYLAPQAMTAPGYRRLLDAAARHLLRRGEPGLMIAPALLTPVQRDRLAEFQGFL
jgi:hypothetical protein